MLKYVAHDKFNKNPINKPFLKISLQHEEIYLFLRIRTCLDETNSGNIQYGRTASTDHVNFWPK